MKPGSIDVAPRFWELVDQGEKVSPKMEGILRTLSHDDLVRFYTEFEYAVTDLASDIEQQAQSLGVSSADLAGWVVSQGRAFYMSVHHNPSSLLSIDTARTDWDCNYGGLAVGVYEERFDDDIPFEEVERWIV